MEELNPLGSLANQTSAIQTINENYEKIEDGINDKLSLTEGGAMLAPLDMNGRRVLNVPAPVTSEDVVRWVDVQTALTPEGVLIPSLVGNSGKFLRTDGVSLSWTPITDSYVLRSNNGSDFTDIPTVRTNLGLGSMAVETATDYDKLSSNVTKTGTLTVNNSVTLGGTADHRIPGSFLTLSPESIGFRGIPTDGQDGSYQFVLNDAAKCKYHTSAVAHAYTVPNDTTEAWPNGTVLLVDNVGTGAVTITRDSGVTIRREGSATSADFVLAQWGVAVLRKRSGNNWVINGSNLT